MVCLMKKLINCLWLQRETGQLVDFFVLSMLAF